MYTFEFERECDSLPAVLRIVVDYNAYYEDSCYEHDSIFEVVYKTYEIYLGEIDITASVNNSLFKSEIIDEIEDKIDYEISNHFFNQ